MDAASVVMACLAPHLPLAACIVKSLIECSLDVTKTPGQNAQLLCARIDRDLLTELEIYKEWEQKLHTPQK